MASFTGVEIVSRLPVINAEAIAPLSPGSIVRRRLSIVTRRHSIEARKRSRRDGACGVSAVRTAPSTRRLCLDLDETADRGCRALAHRHPHAFELFANPWADDALKPHDNAVGALVLFPHLDEAGELDVPGGCRQNRMRDDLALDRGGRQSRPHPRPSHRRSKSPRPKA